MEIKFEKGSYVKYSTNGVCLVDEIGVPDFRADDPADYYILTPLSAKSTTIFVPVDSEVLVSKMRPLLTKEEIDDTVNAVKNDDIEWISDRKERANKFSEILASDRPVDLLRLAGCIYLKKSELEKLNKKLTITDLNALTQAEKLIENEFSFVLGIADDEVTNYIRAKLEQ